MTTSGYDLLLDPSLLDQPFPFDKVSSEDYLPAITTLLAQSKQTFDDLAMHANPTIDDLLIPYEMMGQNLAMVHNTFLAIHEANKDDILERDAPIIARLINDATAYEIANPHFFQKIMTLEQQKNEYDTETQRLIHKIYRRFIKNGANLSPVDQKTLNEMTNTLSDSVLRFANHLLAEENSFFLHFANESITLELPSHIITMMKDAAQLRNLAGYCLTLDNPLYLGFMTYSPHRSQRKILANAYARKGNNPNEHNTQALVRDIARLRMQKAQLLGYPSWAHYVLEDKMAKTPEAVTTMYDALSHKTYQKAQQDYQSLQHFAQQYDQLSLPLQSRDYLYYANKQKKAVYNVDAMLLKPYFSLDRVIKGMMDIAQKLYNLSFIADDTIPTYHPDVKTYRVMKDATLWGILSLDCFPRANKSSGYRMIEHKGQSVRSDGSRSIPQIALVGSYTPPTADTPSLLTFDEVVTLFHEFGHGLHGLCSDVRYPSQAGTYVPYDFVELPSQLMEKRCDDNTTITSFARHWQTNEPIPKAMIENVIAAKDFLYGLFLNRQINQGKIDMLWHTRQSLDDECFTRDCEETEIQEVGQTNIFPLRPGVALSTSFSHIWDGSYSAGYYGYLWADILVEDVRSVFEKEGSMDPTTARRYYETILSRGDTLDPNDAVQQFLGRPYTIDAFLTAKNLDSDAPHD